jgi:HSP20 family molecular chaperone IbpA
MPSDPVENIQRQFERLFHDWVYHRHPSAHFAEQSWVPQADLVVTERSARVIIELAGVPRESVRVRLRGRALEVSGRRVPPQEPAGAHYHRAEIYFGEFSRVIELPWEADDRSVAATYRDGMLEIRLQALPVPAPTDVPVRERAT